MENKFKPIILFVYGTLMRGKCNHDKLPKDGVEFLHPHTLHGCQVIYGMYPYIIGTSYNDTVDGELYNISTQSALKAIDEFEGSPDLYRRVLLKHGIQTYMLVEAADEATLLSMREVYENEI